jgi:hypothetical protein
MDLRKTISIKTPSNQLEVLVNGSKRGETQGIGPARRLN